MTIMHASGSIESVRPLTNDERRASWAAKYFLLGWHRKPQKPRIRLQVTVPEPLRQPAPPAGIPAGDTPFRAPGAVQAPGANLPASPDACSRVQVGAGRQSIHECFPGCEPPESWAAPALPAKQFDNPPF